MACTKSGFMDTLCFSKFSQNVMALRLPSPACWGCWEHQVRSLATEPYTPGRGSCWSWWVHHTRDFAALSPSLTSGHLFLVRHPPQQRT